MRRSQPRHTFCSGWFGGCSRVPQVQNKAITAFGPCQVRDARCHPVAGWPGLCSSRPDAVRYRRWRRGSTRNKGLEGRVRWAGPGSNSRGAINGRRSSSAPLAAIGWHDGADKKDSLQSSSRSPQRSGIAFIEWLARAEALRSAERHARFPGHYRGARARGASTNQVDLNRFGAAGQALVLLALHKASLCHDF